MQRRTTWFLLGLGSFLFFNFSVFSIQNIQSQPPKDGLYVNSETNSALQLIQAAKSTIDIEIYEMTDRDFRSGLRAALARGIRIRVIKDPSPVENHCRTFEDVISTDSEDCKDQKRLVREIRASTGGKYIAFNKDNLCGPIDRTNSSRCFEHGKMILVDGQTVLISTGNFNSTNFCNLSQNPRVCDRDYSYVSRDPRIFAAFKNVFENDLMGEPYDLRRVIEDVSSQITVSPLSLHPLLDFIASARESLEVENQYLKEPSLNAALIEAARRGVKVSITVASFCSFGRPKDSEARKIREIYSAFEDAGIDIQIFDSSIRVGGKPGYLHAKAMVADKTRAWMGSVNGSNSALNINREFGIFFEQKEQVDKLYQTMHADHESDDGETWQESLQCLKD